MQRAFSSVQPVVVVEVLNDGDEVLPALEVTTRLPGLILLDLNMVRMDGLETLEVVRGIPHFGQIPIVVLSTSNNPKDMERSKQLGAEAYYVKPFHYKGMVDLAAQLASEWLA